MRPLKPRSFRSSVLAVVAESGTVRSRRALCALVGGGRAAVLREIGLLVREGRLIEERGKGIWLPLPSKSDELARLRSGLSEISPVDDVELAHAPEPWAEGLPWFWSWTCGHHCASSRAATAEEAIKAACRALQAMLSPDAAEDALDEIARLCGCPEWHYPGQVVRDVRSALARAKLEVQIVEDRRRLDVALALEKVRARGGDGSTTPPGAPYGTGALCNRALCTAIEDRCGLLVGHPGPCEARR